MSKQSEQAKLELLQQQREQLRKELAEVQHTIDEAVNGILVLDRKILDQTSQHAQHKVRRAA